MKKLFRDTLMFDFIGATFCLIVLLVLALMYTGCSDVTAGGTAEETSVEMAFETPDDTSSVLPGDSSSKGKPLYSNLNLVGYARCVAQPPVASPSSSPSSVLDADTVFTLVESERLGHVIRLSELDSTTLEPTGVSFISHPTDTAGAFGFDSVSLNSPYVMLEVSPYHDEEFWLPDSESYYLYGYDPNEYDGKKGRYRVVYKAIVDLRDSGRLEVNSLTFLETARIQHLVKGGAAFASARQQAIEDVLAFLGVGGTAFDMQNPRVAIAEENLGYVLENFARTLSTKEFTDAFATAGTIVGDTWPRTFIARWIFNWYEYYLLNKYGVADDNEIAFMNNFLASFVSAGQCTAEKDGLDTAVYETTFRSLINRKLTLVCESGEWNVTPSRYTMDERVGFTPGTMTDERDGKVYKTVTYVIDGQTQTWFAENLTYSDENIQPSIGLDSAIYYLNGGRDGDFKEYMDSLDASYWETHALYEKSDVIGGDSILMEDGRLQGVCPAGWHVPTRTEWSHLMYFTEVETGMSTYEEAQGILEYEDFGWYASSYLRVIGFGDFTLEPFAILDTSEGNWILLSLVMDNWKPVEWRSEHFAIRCVKD